MSDKNMIKVYEDMYIPDSDNCLGCNYWLIRSDMCTVFSTRDFGGLKNDRCKEMLERAKKESK